MPVQCRLQKDDQGLPCETSAGESASDVMDQAVNECSSAPPPPPPPPSSSGPQTCPAGQHIATSGTSGGGSNSICIKCATNQFKRDESADSCDVCPQGSGMPGGANGNHDDCIECTGAQASPDGVECKTCPSGQLPRDDYTACEVAAVSPSPSGPKTCPAGLCHTTAGFKACSNAVNAACCMGQGQACVNGQPVRCSAGCAAVLRPMMSECTRPGAILSSRHRLSQFFVTFRKELEKGLAKCAKSNGGH